MSYRLSMILLLMLATQVAYAQLYSKEREQAAIDEVRQLLDTYSTGLNAIGNPDEDPDERRSFYVGEFKKVFRQPEALVFNDIEPERRSGTDLPADRYAINHIIWFPKSGITNRLNSAEATFSPIQKTESGSLYINARVTKSVKGVFMNRVVQAASNQLEFRVSFVDKGNYFTNFRIIGITSLATATTASTATKTAPADDPKSVTKSSQTNLEASLALQQVLSKLTGQLLKSGLPKSRAIRVEKFTYAQTGLCSQFSKVINTFLVGRLRQVPGLIILPPPGDLPPGSKKPPVDLAKILITGTFTDEGGQLLMRVTWKDLKTNKTMAIGEQIMPMSDVQALNVPLRPDNFRQAVAVQQALEEGSITSDFGIDVLTNRGGGQLTFNEGDSLKLYVRAEKPCYLRFIYHTADGQRVLLDDNYYVDSLNVNRFVKIQKIFTVTEPFGAEVLQLNAATQPFPPLKVRRDEDFTLILDDIATINKKNRQADSPANTKRAETRLTITTTRKLK